jgi:hypothetical protein
MNLIEDFIEIIIDKYDVNHIFTVHKLNNSFNTLPNKVPDTDHEKDAYSIKLSLMEGGLLSTRDIMHNKTKPKIYNLRNLFYFSNNV